MVKKSWRNLLRGFLTYSRSDRNAILILSILIFTLVLAIFILNNINPVSKSDFSEIKAILEAWEAEKEEIESEPNLALFDFDPNTISQKGLDTLNLPEFIKRNLMNYRIAGGKFKTSDDVRKIYGMNDSIFTSVEAYIKIKEKKRIVAVPKIKKEPVGNFDPNTAPKDELSEFGFTNYQANNLIRYREKGGVFYLPADVLKIYGIDSSFYKSICNHISIEQIAVQPYSEPEPELLIELNIADTIELTKLRGIGASYARRIIKYRDLLGGYYSKNQLSEIYNFPEETYNSIQSHVYTDTLKIEKLRINFAEFSELLRHPYFDRAQVKAIIEKRETQGPIKSISELKALKSFDSETIKKITPYVTCR